MLHRMFIRSNPLRVASVCAALVAAGSAWATAPDINRHTLSGTWADAQTPGQGLVLETVPDLLGAGTGYVFGGWFTYDTSAGDAGRNRWYTLQGEVQAGASAATVDLYESTGGAFASAQPATTEAVGSATLRFDSCTSGSLDYTFDDGRSGVVPFMRIMPSVGCEEDSPPGDISKDFALSGTWADPSTKAQGMVVEVNPVQQYVFLGWFTFPGATSREGQRWFTAQQPYTIGQRTIPLDLYETTGGTFDGVTPVTTTRVGSATITFNSCVDAGFNYSFDAGSLAGEQGTLRLSRLMVSPSVCAR